MKHLFVLVFLGVSLLRASAQSDAFRAQGHYYSAKSNYKAGSNEAALGYVYKCKEILKGTNRELQYIHIMAAYNAGKYEEAQKEMKVFFDLQENNLKPVYFSNSVEKITDNEVLDITKLINSIDSEAKSSKDQRLKQENEDRLKKERQRVFAEAPGKLADLLKNTKRTSLYLDPSGDYSIKVVRGYKDIKVVGSKINFTSTEVHYYLRKVSGSTDVFEEYEDPRTWLYPYELDITNLSEMSWQSYGDNTLIRKGLTHTVKSNIKYLRVKLKKDYYDEEQEKWIYSVTFDGEENHLKEIYRLINSLK